MPVQYLLIVVLAAAMAFAVWSALDRINELGGCGVPSHRVSCH